MEEDESTMELQEASEHTDGQTKEVDGTARTEEQSNIDVPEQDLTENFSLSDKEAEARFIEWYEEICTERIQMSAAEEEYKTQIRELEESENGYKKRIQELETNVSDLMGTFNEVQNEVKMLRTKYEPSDESQEYAESYEVMARERNKLLEDDKQNKKRITVLEDEVKLLRNYVKDFESMHEIRDTKKPNLGSRKGFVVITNSERLDSLEKENIHLKYVNEKLERDREAFNQQIRLLEGKIRTLEKVPTQRYTQPVKRPSDKLVVNRKCVPPFLPKLDGRSSGISSDINANGSSSSSRDSGSRAGLLFGLGYREIYSRKSDASSVSSSYQSLYKYMF